MKQGFVLDDPQEIVVKPSSELNETGFRAR